MSTAPLSYAPTHVMPGLEPVEQRQIFINDISGDTTTSDLRTLFASAGKVTNVEIDTNELNRHFAFVTFETSQGVETAITKFTTSNLNNTTLVVRRRTELEQMRQTRMIHARCKLFVGNIPQQMAPNELRREIERLSGRPIADFRHKKGYCFVGYASPKDAEDAKRNLKNAICGGKSLNAEFKKEDPIRNEPGFIAVLEQAQRTLYVRDIPGHSNPDSFKKTFEIYGKVRKFTLPTENRSNKLIGYAFIEYFWKEDCDKALQQTKNLLMDGVKIEIRISDPPKDKAPTHDRGRNRHKGRDNRGMNDKRYNNRGRDDRGRHNNRDRFSRNNRRSRSRSRSRSRDRQTHSHSRYHNNGHSHSHNRNTHSYGHTPQSYNRNNTAVTHPQMSNVYGQPNAVQYVPNNVQTYGIQPQTTQYTHTTQPTQMTYNQYIPHTTQPTNTTPTATVATTAPTTVPQTNPSVPYGYNYTYAYNPYGVPQTQAQAQPAQTVQAQSTTATQPNTTANNAQTQVKSDTTAQVPNAVPYGQGYVYTQGQTPVQGQASKVEVTQGQRPTAVQPVQGQTGYNYYGNVQPNQGQTGYNYYVGQVPGQTGQTAQVPQQTQQYSYPQQTQGNYGYGTKRY